MPRLARCGMALGAVLGIVLANTARVPAQENKTTAGESAGRLEIEPKEFRLVGTAARQQMLVTHFDKIHLIDVTRQVAFHSSHPEVASLNQAGVVTAKADGQATITVRWNGLSDTAHVTVTRAAVRPPINFPNQVVPVLAKAGCNAGSCHGKASGQNGFKLSIFGFDPVADYDALVKEARGRRVFPVAPEQSLLLLKATGRMAHGGGRRITHGSHDYDLLLRWVREGLRFGEPQDPVVVGIRLTPAERVMSERATQQVIVTATLSDGTTRDITEEAVYSSNDEAIAGVNRQALVTTNQMAGEAAIMARYLDQVALMRVIVPIPASPTVRTTPVSKDPIDALAAQKWHRLTLTPSAPCGDATFLRRAFLDTIGRLPSAAEARTFLADRTPDRRARLVDALLERPEFADYWAMRWADLLRVNREELGARPSYVFDSWLRECFRRNKPYDVFVREVITAQGNSHHEGPVNFYRSFKTPAEATTAISQVFLGIRLECAQCHHHPYEGWGQDDFYGLAAFFPTLHRKAGPEASEFVFTGGTETVRHPLTNAVVKPRPLRGTAFEPSLGDDPRKLLADWMTNPANPFLARALVNRVWAHFLGRGLVEPIDDMRVTNPAVNEPLLDWLVQDFVAHNYDLKHLLRRILNAQVYQLSSETAGNNARDTRNYSRFYRKRLPAEVLLDAICDVTGVPESFEGAAPGTRAVQLWNNKLPSAFLEVFGRPQRKTVCECERLSDPTLAQILHLMNAPLLHEKISTAGGRADQLARSNASVEEIIDEVFLGALSRFPTLAERAAARSRFTETGANRRAVTEDLLWAAINTAEFILNH